MSQPTPFAADAFAAPDVRPAPSPNREARPGGRAPDLVVLHYTGMRTAQEALARLRDASAKVSSHYVIAQTGEVFGLVPEAERAWHAGVSSWEGQEDVNSRAIGVELVNPGHPWDGSPEGYAPFPDRQMVALERVLTRVLERWRLPPAAVVAHSDVAPGRKIDPGEKFDWLRLARSGLALGPPQTIARSGERSWASFRRAATEFGYGDWADEAVLDAFRRRFRPTALARAFEADDIDMMRAVVRVKSQSEPT
ncbi:MAG: N-acetylmuramoyl-L-alanine amidase [Pseudomonadota bacterium]